MHEQVDRVRAVGSSRGQQTRPPLRRRRKPLPTPPGQKSDAELIREHIKSKGVTMCRPGWAIGSIRSNSLGLEG